MISPEQLLLRNESIGASDCGTVLGVNAWRTPYELWLRKTGRHDGSSNIGERGYIGNMVESSIVAMYEDKTGTPVTIDEKTYYHPDFDYITCHVDGLIGDDGVLEAKSTNPISYRKLWNEDTNKIPDSYYAQVQHMMWVLKRDYADVAVLVGNEMFRIYKIVRDDLYIADMRLKLIDFWELVITDVPPKIDFANSRALDVVKEKNNSVSDEKVFLENGHLELSTRLLSIKRDVKALNGEAKKIEAELREQVGDAGIGIFSDGSCFVRTIVAASEVGYKRKQYIKFTYKKSVPKEYDV